MSARVARTHGHDTLGREGDTEGCRSPRSAGRTHRATTVNDVGLCLAAKELDEIPTWIAEFVELRSIAAWDVDRAMRLVLEFQRLFVEAAQPDEDIMAVGD